MGPNTVQRVRQIGGDFGNAFIHGGVWETADGDVIYTRGAESDCSRHSRWDDSGQTCMDKPRRCQVEVYRWESDLFGRWIADFESSIPGILSACGWTREFFDTFTPAGKSEAYADIFGAYELDQYPIIMSESELLAYVGE